LGARETLPTSRPASRRARAPDFDLSACHAGYSGGRIDFEFLRRDQPSGPGAFPIFSCFGVLTNSVLGGGRVLKFSRGPSVSLMSGITEGGEGVWSV